MMRIREHGTNRPWGFGVETPIPGCTFVDLKPDTQYELQIRAKNAAGDGPPSYLAMRVDRAGGSRNIIPFP